jgi:radical SAM protein with 4Fe4S-binding SPASM domain
MELTFRCNLRCAHCYVLDQGDTDAELSTQEIEGLIDQFVEEGLLWLHLTGGEPLLREDFEEIYLYAKRKGLILVLFTNGTRVTERVADLLGSYPPITTEITIYGATAETHDLVTGVPGSFDSAVRGIDRLIARGIRLKLKTMLMTLNEHELDGMKSFASSRGLSFRYDPRINGSIDGSGRPFALRLSPERIVEIESRDGDRLEEYEEFTGRYWGPPGGEFLFPCGAGLNAFHVDPFGHLSPCMMARFHTYDLRRGSFRKAWHEFIPSLRALKRTRRTKCDDCEIAALCGNCPGWAFLEHGDPEEPVTFLCELAHLQRDIFGLDGIKEVPDETAVSKA